MVLAVVLVSVLITSCSHPKEVLPADGLVERIAPQFSGNIIFEQIGSPSGQDIFELESVSGGKIRIGGNTPVAMAVDFNYYLRYYCKTSVSWFVGQPVQLPEVMPRVPEKVRKEARVDRRFFLNYCTYGYTMPWWQWRDWERLIDWMALNGINMPLATTGQEAVWYKVWRDFGMSDQEICSYFTGPAHLPWHRMSNIDRLGGPLPRSYMDHQVELQNQILSREREMGMTPVLPAFNGHVPEQLGEIFPEASISRLGGGLENPYSCYILDPMDSLFFPIQKAFLEEQTRLFGTDHLYGVDPLNEVEPPSWDSSYLANLSGTIYKSMARVDPGAAWVQMGWMFYFSRDHWTNRRVEAMLKAVPQDKMILLDYFCDHTEVWKITEKFFGQPYIWCYLGNFGGNTVLAGNMKEAGQRLENAMQEGGENLRGIGSTPEGLDVNPMVYEYIFERVWETGRGELDRWFEQWADRRCGYKDENVREAWQILLDIVYDTVPTLAQVPTTNLRPVLHGNGSYWVGWQQWTYDNSDLFHAWELMLKARDSGRDAFQYDVVNTGRQVLANYFHKLEEQFTDAYHRKDLDVLKATGEQMMELLADLDSLLGTRHSFLLGAWIKDARSFGVDEQESAFYEKNARMIITSVAGIYHPLNDYASRNWSGLTAGYYARRWEIFIDEVVQSVEEDRAFDEQGYLDREISFEREWESGREKYSALPVGSSLQIATGLMEKYRDQIASQW